MSAPRVSVIVPARDAAHTLGAALDGLAAQRLDDPYEVIVVVDRASADDTVELAERHPSGPCVVYRDGLAAGAARNLGVAAAAGSVLAFTDSDCVPSEDWLAAGLQAIATLDIVQGTVLADPAAQAGRGPFDRTLEVLSEYGLYETANLFVRRELFDSLGGFEDLALADERPFGEDTDFVWRARRAGARVGFSDEAAVHHAVLPGSAADYVAERARRRYFPRLVKLVPELRDALLTHRVFLSERTAAFDLAVVATLAAGRRRSPLPLVLATPYLLALRGSVTRWHPDPALAARLTLAELAADAVSFAALVRGSIETRTPVL